MLDLAPSTASPRAGLGTSPEEAANFVASLPAGKTQNSAAVNVLLSWSTADPASAGNWVAQFPESDLRNEAMRVLLNSWAQNDPTGAGQFLAGLPEGNSRDSAAQSYVSHLAQSPEQAAPYVNFIADDNQRFSSAQSLAGSYLRNDPAGAETWITGLNLSPEQKNQLRSLK